MISVTRTAGPDDLADVYSEEGVRLFARDGRMVPRLCSGAVVAGDHCLCPVGAHINRWILSDKLLGSSPIVDAGIES